MKNFKKIDVLLKNITKNIFKRHDSEVLFLLQNWEKIVGEKYSNFSKPVKISKSGLLTIQTDYVYFLDLQYNSPEILKKINSLLRGNIIYKIKIVLKG